MKNKHARSYEHQRGFAMVMVASVLMVITVLGLSAVMFSTGELEGVATSRQRENAKYCAELGMANVMANLAIDAGVLVQTSISIVNYNTGTVSLPHASGGSTVYEYWVGHYGQKGSPILSLVSTEAEDLESGTGDEFLDFVNNITNVDPSATIGTGGSSSTKKEYEIPVTCRSPSGTEVEVFATLVRGY